ncbi:MAG TPA: hypothetical protein VFW18_00005, partial [Gaiellales bacterium]|nr:hypothetical protein [Gaiellales bacterium]
MPVAIAGIAAAVLSLIDPVPYVRDILRGLTRPHRGTWLIWSALGATAFASQFADGASWSLAMVGVQLPDEPRPDQADPQLAHRPSLDHFANAPPAVEDDGGDRAVPDRE